MLISRISGCKGNAFSLISKEEKEKMQGKCI